MRAISQIWLLRLSDVDDAHDDPRPGAVDAAGARLRRAARAGELAAPTSGPTSQPGSIYHALRKLAEEGLLAEVATEQVGARPARTTYRSPTKGDARVRGAAARGTGGSYEAPIDPFLAAAFAFLPALPPGRRRSAALRNRARLLRADGESHAVRARERLRCEQTKPVHVGWMFELMIGRARRPRSPGASGSPTRIEGGCRTCRWMLGGRGRSTWQRADRRSRADRSDEIINVD